MNPFLRGHLMRFDPPTRLMHTSRLLVLFVLVEFSRVLIGRHWGLLPMFGFSILAVSQLQPRRKWTLTEKLYFAQTVPITIAIFSVMNLGALRTIPSHWQASLLLFATQMTWGFYQEAVYRGLLQSGLVGKFGSRAGILASNLIFTFGPLHFYHFRASPLHWWIFTAIFTIGLYFALIFHRSGNIWIVGTMHGLGDWFIDGLGRSR